MRRIDDIGAVNRLFDAIGEIEDRWIAEAETVYTPERRFCFGRRSLIVAATLALVTVSTLGVLVANRSMDKGAPEAESPVTEQAIGTVGTLSERMALLKAQTVTLRVNPAELDLFDGSARIVWKYRDEADYRARAITQRELSQLLDAMERNPGSSVAPSDSVGMDALEGVWIAYGNGTVISPCLKTGDGNEGFGELFAYEPELEPSEEFADTLCGIIS